MAAPPPRAKHPPHAAADPAAADDALAAAEAAVWRDVDAAITAIAAAPAAAPAADPDGAYDGDSEPDAADDDSLVIIGRPPHADQPHPPAEPLPPPAGTPSTGDLLPAAEYPVSLRARRASRRSAALDDAGAGSGSGSGDDRRGRSDRGDGGRDDGSRGRGLLDDAPASRAAVLGDSAVRAGLASDPPERVASSDHVRASSAGPGDAAAEGCAAADAPHGLEGVPLQDAPSLVDDVIDSILTPGLSPRLQLVMHACFALLVATLLALLFVSGLNPHVAVLLSVAVMLWASTAWFLSNLHSLSPGAPDPAESRKAI